MAHIPDEQRRLTSPRTLPGFMELLPAPQARMQRLMDVVADTYALYGFARLDTPVIEDASVLLAKGSGESDKQLYTMKKGDSDLALRFDLTVPLAKYVALHYGQLTFPFRRFQIGKVYRGEKAQRGRFREFYQADIDVIGDGALSVMHEAEIPAIIERLFTALGLTRFQIRINNRKILSGFFALLGLEAQAGDIMRTVDRLEKIGPDKTRAMLLELELSHRQVGAIMEFISCPGDNAAKLEFLRGYTGRNDGFDAGYAELTAVLSHLRDFGVPEHHCVLDLTIARGLDYYTGTVYETRMLDHPEIGSICSGGRYDNLAEYYTRKALPGVGISIGLTRLFYVLEEQDLLSLDVLAAPADALVIPMTEDFGPAIAAATALRAAGVRTQIYLEERKFKAKIGYADKLGIPFAVFLGEDEIAAGEVSLKNMHTGEQIRLTAGNAAAHIAAALESRKNAPLIAEKTPTSEESPHA